MRGFAIVASAALLLVSMPNPSAAQPREESQEEFNARAQAQQDAYARLQEAERQAREEEQAASSDNPPRQDPSSNASGTDAEIIGLQCLNDNRAAVQLSPLSLQEYREGRAAGMIAGADELCNRGVSTSESEGDFSETTPATGVPLADRSSPPNNDLANTLILSFFALCALLYFVPSFIAFRRGHHYRWIILALNVTSGWTGIAWVSVFIWAIWPRNRALAEPLYGDATGIEDRR